MSEEVSETMKISITMIMIASLLAAMINVAIHSEKLMATIQNDSAEAVTATSVAGITRLQKDYRKYIDLYRAYEYYEENINSICGKNLDGTTTVLYLRNADHIDHTTTEYINCIQGKGFSGLVNKDNMYKDFLNKYCDEAHANVYIKVYTYRSFLDDTYDIYYEVVDR